MDIANTSSDDFFRLAFLFLKEGRSPQISAVSSQCVNYDSLEKV